MNVLLTDDYLNDCLVIWCWVIWCCVIQCFQYFIENIKSFGDLCKISLESDIHLSFVWLFLVLLLTPWWCYRCWIWIVCFFWIMLINFLLFLSTTCFHFWHFLFIFLNITFVVIAFHFILWSIFIGNRGRLNCFVIYYLCCTNIFGCCTILFILQNNLKFTLHMGFLMSKIKEMQCSQVSSKPKTQTTF